MTGRAVGDAKILGIAGHAGAGKDTLADLVCGMTGQPKRSFAAPLRDAVLAFNPWIRATNPNYIDPNQVTEKELDSLWPPTRYADLIALCGYERAKWHEVYGAGVREAIQRMGTEVGRGLLGESVWVDIAMSDRVHRERPVFADVRFPNEAQAIKDRGGVVVWIERPGVAPANGHISESALDKWIFDRVIDNDNDTTVLHQKAFRLVLELM